MTVIIKSNSILTNLTQRIFKKIIVKIFNKKKKKKLCIMISKNKKLTNNKLQRLI